MTEAEATARIQEDTQYLSAPTLSTAEITRLVLRARVADTALLLPGATGYVPTWDDAGVRGAVSLGWTWKAAKRAGEFEVSVGSGKTFKRDQVYAMCLAMARRYGGGAVSSVALTLGGR